MSTVRKPTQALVGRRVKLIKGSNSHYLLVPDATGIVDSIDDANGDVFVKWDNIENPIAVNWERGDRWSVVTKNS